MAAISNVISAVRSAANQDQERGATAIEYGVILSLFSVLLVAALIVFGEPVRGVVDAAFLALDL